MRKYTLLITITLFIFGCASKKYNPEIEPYVKFLKSHKQSGVDYILSLYDKYDIVVFGEREHPEMGQYDFLKKLISSEKFIDGVGDIYIEIGGVNMLPRFDELLLGDIPADSVELGKKIAAIQRDASLYGLWNPYSYYYFLYTVAEINRDLPADKKIRVIPVDVPVDWSEINNLEDYGRWADHGYRDSVMAANAVYRYKESSREKALVIMNSYHAQFNTDKMGPVGNRFMSWFVPGTGKKVANVKMHSTTVPFYDDYGSTGLINHGKWDAAFIYTDADDIGFNFEGSPFGEDNFDFHVGIDTDLQYKDVYTGMIYLPLEGRVSIRNYPGFIDEQAMPGIVNRLSMFLPEITPDFIDETFNNSMVMRDFEEFSDRDGLVDYPELRDSIYRWLE